MPTTLIPDLSLLRNYLPEDDLIDRPPCISHFSRDEKDLFFINAHHVSGTDNPTCAAVRHVFDACDPRFLINEGYPTQWGISPERYIEIVRRREKQDFIEGGESAFSTFLAYSRAIPFQGGEPTDTELFVIAQNYGYSSLDFTGYNLLLYVPQDQRTGITSTEDELRKLARERLGREFDYISESEKPDFNMFLDWLKQHNGSPALLAMKNEDAMPSGAADARWLQKLTATMSHARDAHLLNLIASRLDEHGRVLVVYGDGHLVTCRAVLENMMGAPIVIDF